MGAPIGNKYAAGKGGKMGEWTKLAKELKTKVVTLALEYMDSTDPKDQKVKNDIMMRVLPNCVPKEVEADVKSNITYRILKAGMEPTPDPGAAVVAAEIAEEN